LTPDLEDVVFAGRISIVPKAFPADFRRDLVAVAREGQAPLSQIVKDFGISESCLHRWLKVADIEDGVRLGVTAAEGYPFADHRGTSRQSMGESASR
jgi:transposase-like protein